MDKFSEHRDDEVKSTEQKGRLDIKSKEERQHDEKDDVPEEVIDINALIENAREHLRGPTFAMRPCSKPSRGGQRRRRKARLVSFDPSILLTDYRIEDLFEWDAYGWAPIHYAAFRGFCHCLEIMITEVPTLLNFKTNDGKGSTPLMLAVMSAELQTVKCLLDMGASIETVNRLRHGIVELCAFKQFTHILQYLIDKDYPNLPVWRNLVGLLGSAVDSDVLAAAKCLRAMTMKIKDDVNPNWKPICDNGFGEIIVEVLSSEFFDEPKVEALHTTLNIIGHDDVKRLIVKHGIIPPLVMLLQSANNLVVRLSANVIKAICEIAEFADMVVASGAIEALVDALKNVQETQSVVAVVEAIGSIVATNRKFQDLFGELEGAVEALIARFEGCESRSLLLALTQTMTRLVTGHMQNQTRFIRAGVGPYLVNLVKVKNRDLMMSTLVAIKALAEKNSFVQKALLAEGAIVPILQTLKRSRHTSVQEKTVEALWAIAGDDSNERLQIAEMIGVRILVEFVLSPSAILNFIGADAIGVLSSAPLGLHDAMATVGGVEALTTLVRKTDREETLGTAVIALRFLCYRTGFVVHRKNQETLAECQAIKTLIDLMMNPSTTEIIRAETAYTLGCIAMCNMETLRLILETENFCFKVILELLNSENPEVQMLAGASLTSFCYNSVQNQQLIAKISDLFFSRFLPLIQSKDEIHSANASFQVVIMARMFVDKRQANAAAVGIKTLADLIVRSKSDAVLSLTANFFAALSHTRAGIPNAFISIEVVHSLSRQLLHPFEIARGNAAIALGYLSCNPEARRQLLNECRLYPLLMKILQFYTQDNRLCDEFLEDWTHYLRVGVPPIDQSKAHLVRRREVQVLDEVRPMTLSGDDDPGYDPLEAAQRAAAGDADDTVEMADASKPRRRSKRYAKEKQSTPAADVPSTPVGVSRDSGEEEMDTDEEKEEEEKEEEEEEEEDDKMEEEEKQRETTFLTKVERKSRCPPCKTKKVSTTSSNTL